MSVQDQSCFGWVDFLRGRGEPASQHSPAQEVSQPSGLSASGSFLVLLSFSSGRSTPSILTLLSPTSSGPSRSFLFFFAAFQIRGRLVDGRLPLGRPAVVVPGDWPRVERMRSCLGENASGPGRAAEMLRNERASKRHCRRFMMEQCKPAILPL